MSPESEGCGTLYSGVRFGMRSRPRHRAGTACEDRVSGVELPAPGAGKRAARTFEEAFSSMGAIVPIVIVVVFWMIVGVFAVALFRRWLHVPTEAELEMAHGHGAHAAEAREDKVEQTAAR